MWGRDLLVLIGRSLGLQYGVQRHLASADYPTKSPRSNVGTGSFGANRRFLPLDVAFYIIGSKNPDYPLKLIISFLLRPLNKASQATYGSTRLCQANLAQPHIVVY